MQAVHGIGSPLPDPIDRLALLKHENRENGTTAHSPEQLSSSSAVSVHNIGIIQIAEKCIVGMV